MGNVNLFPLLTVSFCIWSWFIVILKDNSKHGYGLSNIRKSIEKYNGHIDVRHEGNVFSVGILLYVDDL